MGVESTVEQGLKTAFLAATNALAVEKRPAYRCFWLDDNEGSNAEAFEYPHVAIVAQPNVPDGHLFTFRHVPVELTFATHRADDPVHADLIALYAACRAVIDANPATVDISPYSLTGIIVEDGGAVEVEENEQKITLPITVRLCGA